MKDWDKKKANLL